MPRRVVQRLPDGHDGGSLGGGRPRGGEDRPLQTLFAQPARGSGSPRRWPVTALTRAAASVFVGVAVLTSRLAGPELAGAVAAFPAVSSTVAVAVVTFDGPPAGAHALAGVVRSLPCYLAFCLAIVLAAPSLGPAATAVGGLACAAAAAATWRGVRVTPSAAAR